MEFAELIKTPKVDGVVLHTTLNSSADVALCLTGHHLILSARKEGVEELWILHQNIDCIERKPNGFLNGSIIIKCKDFRIIQLDINTYEEYNNVATSLEQLSNLDDTTLLYPFFYRPMYTVLEDGWSAFRPESEFSRLLVPGSSEEWRITYVNKDFTICGTYPSAVVVPKSIDDDTLIAASKFRHGGRFPVLSYKHESGSVLMRASQPLAGPGMKRCKEDERLLNSILNSAINQGRKGYIIDTRSQSLAQTAKARGGGVEPEAHYPQWKRIHKPIDRHPVLLESLTKLIEACNDGNMSSDRWLSRLDNSNWLTHVRDSLHCACLIAQCLDQENASVLVHGSEGLDSTLLVSALTQVILNPDCRTVRGMEALVEREWLQAGHPFSLRHRRGCFANSSMSSSGNKSVKGQHAPTFLLFLDCVAQIHIQFPCSFEFSSSLLIILFEHSYSSQFGTFLGNCEADRERLKLSKQTVSLWSHLNRPEILPSLLNPLYEPNSRVIWPSVAPMSLSLWSELFLRYTSAWANGLSLRCKTANIAIRSLCTRDQELRSKAAKLRRHLAELEKEAVEVGILIPNENNTSEVKITDEIEINVSPSP